MRTVDPDVKGDTMSAHNWAGQLLIGAVTVAGCGDDNDSCTEDAGSATRATATTEAATAASTTPETGPVAAIARRGQIRLIDT